MGTPLVGRIGKRNESNSASRTKRSANVEYNLLFESDATFNDTLHYYDLYEWMAFDHKSIV